MQHSSGVVGEVQVDHKHWAGIYCELESITEAASSADVLICVEKDEFWFYL